MHAVERPGRAVAIGATDCTQLRRTEARPGRTVAIGAVVASCAMIELHVTTRGLHVESSDYRNTATASVTYILARAQPLRVRRKVEATTVCARKLSIACCIRRLEPGEWRLELRMQLFPWHL